MSRVNIAAARQRTSQFLNANVDPLPETFIHGLQFEHPKDFTDYVNSLSKDTGWDELEHVHDVPFTHLNYRQALERLPQAYYHILIIEEDFRRAVQKECPEFQTLIRKPGGGISGWESIPKHFYDFLDGLIEFSTGGPPPSASVMREGMAILREWKDQSQKLSQKGSANKKDADALEEDSLSLEVGRILTFYLNGIDAVLPTYIPPQVKQQMDALREEQTRGRGPDFIQRLNQFRSEVFRPLVEANFTMTAEDYRDSANSLGMQVQDSQETTVFLQQVYDQTALIAKELGMVLDEGKDTPPPTHRRRF